MATQSQALEMTILKARVAELEQLVSKMAVAIGTDNPVKMEEDATLAPLLTKGGKPKKPKGLNKDGSERKKRGATGYNLFTKEVSADARANLLHDSDGTDGKLGRGAVQSEVAKRWKALTDEERAFFNDRAKEENASGTDEEQ